MLFDSEIQLLGTRSTRLSLKNNNNNKNTQEPV